jgi:hypothetical protein
LVSNIYKSEFATAAANLTAAYPGKWTDKYRHEKPYPVHEVIDNLPSALHAPKDLAKAVDMIKSTAKHDAVRAVASMGEQAAELLRRKYPETAARRKAIFNSL